MKRMACWTLVMLLGAGAAVAERNVAEDPSANQALLRWSDPAAWRLGLVYAHLSRQVELEGAEWRLRGQGVDAAIGVSPWPWMLLYGQAGGSQARLDGVMDENTDYGAGGLLGVRVNLWQLYEGVQNTAWRVTLGLAGQYAFRAGADNGDGDIEWRETLVMLPLDYHLTFARSFRNFYMAEFHSLAVYAGPAFSKLDGTWTRQAAEQDFEEVQSFGVVGGVELWLLENLAFGARADWFDGTAMQLSLRYRF